MAPRKPLLNCPLHFRLKTCEHGSKGWHHKFSHYLGVLLIALKRGFVRQRQKGDKKPIKNSLFPTIKRWPCALPGESHCIQKHLPVQRHFRSKQALNAGILDLKLSMYFFSCQNVFIHEILMLCGDSYGKRFSYLLFPQKKKIFLLQKFLP